MSRDPRDGFDGDPPGIDGGADRLAQDLDVVERVGTFDDLHLQRRLGAVGEERGQVCLLLDLHAGQEHRQDAHAPDEEEH